MDISDSEEKRKAAAGLIEKYYYQLRVGCGNKNCDNPNCASSGQNPSTLSPDDAAARAILCVKVRTVVSSSSPQSPLLRPRTPSVLSTPRLTRGPGRLQRRRRRWRFVPKEEVVVLDVLWLPGPAVSMCRPRHSVPVRLKVITTQQSGGENVSGPPSLNIPSAGRLTTL